MSEDGLLGLTLKFASDVSGCSDLFLEFFLYPLVDDEQDCV